MIHLLSVQTTRNASSPTLPDFVGVAKQCVPHPNTLCKLSLPTVSNVRAWDLLRRILDEKGFVQAHLPFEIVNWITNESREDTKTAIPNKVDEIEKEVHEFMMQLETGETRKESPASKQQIRGWRMWEGDWTPKPIGVTE